MFEHISCRVFGNKGKSGEAVRRRWWN